MLRILQDFLDAEAKRIRARVEQSGGTVPPAAFWTQSQGRAEQVILPGFEDAFTNAVKRLQATMPEAYAVGVDWALVNEDALAYAKSHALLVAGGVTDTTHERVKTLLADWIEAGDPLPALSKSITTALGGQGAEARAALIATTEVTNAFAQANVLAWQQSDVINAQCWNTANDGLVDPDCQARDGKVYGLGHGDGTPPAHPNCRCWLSPVVKGS